MKNILTHTVLATTFAVIAFAQAPQTNQTTNISGAQEPAAQQPVSSSGQTFRGVLMDASCSVIQSRDASSAAGTDVSRSRATPTAQSDPRGAAAAASTNIGGAASTAPSGAGASGSLSTTTNSGGTAASPATAATTGVNPNHAGQATANATTPPAEHRSTASAAAAGATGSSSVTTYSGPAAAGSANATTAQGSIPSGGTVSIRSEAAATGDRSRSADTAQAGADLTTVREKYKDCKVTPTTSSFALMSEGKLYMIDDSTGSIRERMNSAGTAREWQSLTITGTMSGDRINASSVQ
jgi:peptidoglycan DL-endopeptidase CwlO